MPETAPRDDSRSDRELLCDLTNGAKLQSVFETDRIDGIVHLAAILPTAARPRSPAATQVNVEGRLNLLEMVQPFAVRRIILGSSLSLYGACPANKVSEADRAAPEDLYGAAKLYVEHPGEAYRNGHGLEFVSLRVDASSVQGRDRCPQPGGVRFLSSSAPVFRRRSRCPMGLRKTPAGSRRRYGEDARDVAACLRTGAYGL